MIAKQIADKAVFRILQEQFDDWKWESYRSTTRKGVALGHEQTPERSVVWAKWGYEDDCVTIEIEKDDEVQTTAIYTLDQIMEVM